MRKMKKIHLIMPMGGEGSRFRDQGYTCPKPLMMIKGRPFFFWAVMSVLRSVEVEDITFVVLESHIKKFEIDKQILNLFPEANIVCIPHVLPGAALTCLEGVRNIHDGLPVLFNDCDHMFFCKNLSKLIEQDPDGILLTFLADQPRFSYVQYAEDGEIIGTVEKRVVSDHAICGAYYFKNAELFRETLRIYRDECAYTELFVSGLYNIICRDRGVVKDCLLDAHVEFGTPQEYEDAKESERFDLLEENTFGG